MVKTGIGRTKILAPFSHNCNCGVILVANDIWGRHVQFKEHIDFNTNIGGC